MLSSHKETSKAPGITVKLHRGADETETVLMQGLETYLVYEPHTLSNIVGGPQKNFQFNLK